jgi:hypothetical protein
MKHLGFLHMSLLLLLLLSATSVTNAYCSSPNNKPAISRRGFALSLPFIAAAAAAATPTISNALDMDAFMKKELESDTSPKETQMSDDEALCRFGQPSKDTGEACVRAGLPTTKKSGVDAFGKVDRGDYVRCKPDYVYNGTKLVNVWKCQ